MFSAVALVFYSLGTDKVNPSHSVCLLYIVACITTSVNVAGSAYFFRIG